MSATRITFFFGVMFAVLGVLNVYVHRRVSSALRLERRGRRRLAWALGSVLVAMVAARFADGHAPDVVARIFAGASWDGELALLISAALLLVVDLARGLGRLARRAVSPARAGRALFVEATAAGDPSGPTATLANDALPAETRRDFLYRAAVGGAIVVGSGTVGYGAFFGRHDYTLEEVPIRLRGLSPRLDGLTIVQLSDLHIGLFVGDAEMRSAVELARRGRPDLIVLTGDLVDHDPRFTPRLTELTSRLAELARYGVIVIPGNHDYYTGVDDVLAAATRGGAKVLRNASHLLDDGGARLSILGVDDVHARRTGGGPDLARAALDLPDDVPRVLLCHNPIFFPEAAGAVDLQLSGHTHGGQVNLVVRPGDLVLPHGYVAGRYELGRSTLYVNRGFGTAGPPARIGAPPEVSRIVLVSA